MPTKRMVTARALGGRRVITNKGAEVGTVDDLKIDESDGAIVALIVVPDAASSVAKNLPAIDNVVMIPYKAVMAMSDHIVVDENQID